MATIKKKTARNKTTATARRKQAATKKKAMDKRKALTNKMRGDLSATRQETGRASCRERV